MNAKKRKQTVIWQMLFSYLVVSKVLYYSDFITTALGRDGLRGMGEALLNRLLIQDVLIILIILLTFNTERLVALKITQFNKSVNQIIVHIIDYAIYMGVLAIYFWGMLFFGFSQNFSWLVALIYSSIVYLLIVAAVETKKYFKKKEMTEQTLILSADEKLAMLKILLDNNVLTQEEYDCKKKKLLGAGEVIPCSF
ncbi:MAG: SHOCT domain-containing protein [Defluviitaleaceae bacterium]|nr:SHOCT domain-containing protein [Defluviitaleaceae bacterium]